MNENVAAGSAAGAAIKCCHANWPPQAHLRHEGEQGTACVLCSIPLALGTQQHTSNGRVARLVLRGSGCCCAERLQGLALSPCARASAPAAQCTDGVGSWSSDAVIDNLRAGEHCIGAPSLSQQASKQALVLSHVVSTPTHAHSLHGGGKALANVRCGSGAPGALPPLPQRSSLWHIRIDQHRTTLQAANCSR